MPLRFPHVAEPSEASRVSGGQHGVHDSAPRGPVVRPEIARITGLSSAAVTKAVKPMIEAGYLEELPQGPRTVEGAGRPAHPSPSAPTGSSSWASRSRPTNSSVWSPT
ncbi:winged helix-turn-helix transcriptional regulator [Streptomyces aureus]